MKFAIFTLTTLAAVSTASAFSDATYNYLVEMANWASVGYCIHNFGWYDLPNLEAPDLSTGELKNSCPLLSFCESEYSDVDIVQIFNPVLTEFQIAGSGFIAVDHANSRVITVFRGSATVGDWLTDFEFLLIPYEPIAKSYTTVNYTDCEGCYVHKGIYKTIEGIAEQAFSTLLDLKVKYPSYKFITTGHSLGGGLTNLAGIEFTLLGLEPSIVSLAGLKIGNVALSEYTDSILNTDSLLSTIEGDGDITDLTGFTRVVHEADIVPLIPPTPIFAHGGVEFYINKVDLPHPKSVVELIGKYVYEPLISQFQNILSQISEPGKLLTIYEHNHYFIPMYGCGAPSLVDILPGANEPSGTATASAIYASDLTTASAATAVSTGSFITAASATGFVTSTTGN